MYLKKIILLFIALFIYSFAFSQLSNQNKVTIGKWVLDENLPKCIEVELKGNVGNYPNWDGFFSIVNDLSKSVQNKLRSTQPYKVVPYQSVLKTNFTVIDTNYTRIKNSGNLLILGITLQECTEKERDWYFDFFALLYPATQSVSKNTLDAESEPVMFRYSNIESRIDRKWNDIQTIEHLNYPSPESYKIITNLVIGPKYKNEVEYQEYLSLQKTNENKPIELTSSNTNNKISSNHENSKSVEINKSNSEKTENSTLSDDPSIAINQLIKLKSVINSSKKMTATQKQEALVKLNDAIKQYRDLIELKKLGQKWDEFMNFNDGRKENGKITNSRLLEYLNEVDKKLLLRILNREIDLDPQSKHGSSCGTIVTNCRYCGDRISVTSRYRSIGYTIRDLNDLPVFYVLNESEVKELKSYFQKIRSGNYYFCDAYNDEKFCSKQHKYFFEQR